MTRIFFPIKAKLTVATLLPLTVAIVVCWFTGVVVITTRTATQAQEKVRSDLNAARAVYTNEMGHIRDVVKFTAVIPYSAVALSGADRSPLPRLLTPLLASEKLDILTAIDATGRVVFRAANPAAQGDDLTSDPIIARALRGESFSGTIAAPASRLLLEGEHLARRAVIQSIPTPHARTDGEKVEKAGMLLAAAEPVRDETGRVVGALYGALLLNNDNRLVDRIKQIVYEGGQFGDRDLGAATIFLGDLRIATNVLGTDKKRAIGTRLSNEVYERVILHGEKWFDRAFVVNDWHFAAYEPLRSPSGVPIGALYVGMLERPTGAVRTKLGLLYSGVLLIGTLFGLAISGYVGSRFTRPIRELETLAKRVTAGERDVRAMITSRDEMGELAREFNEMTRALSEREAEIYELNRNLEEKVRQRTEELEEKNRLLVLAREELVRAEKLAAIGELAAGVAHEINNPMAIIRGNTELLQMELPSDNPAREEVDIIYRQVGRIERIVSNLLRFARQEQRVLAKFSLPPLLDEILDQIGHQVSLDSIEVRRQYPEDLPHPEGDSDQLRQVFINLIINAVQAMPGGGILTIEATAKRDGCTVAVSDTGIGIPAESRQNIFNPFYTTKTRGTGLGLSVSYGIVRAHGGRIEMESTQGQGTTFRVFLPVTRDGECGDSVSEAGAA